MGSELPPNIVTTLEFGICMGASKAGGKVLLPIQTASHKEEPELLAWETGNALNGVGP